MIRNKVNGILAASALLAMTAVSPANAQEIGMETATPQAIESRTVTKVGTVIDCPSGLNMRKGASTSTSVIKTLTNGTNVTVLSTSNNWHKVVHNGTTGYVYAKYIKVSTSSSDVAMSATGKVVSTNGDGLNLRTKPSTSSSVVLTIPENATFTITAKNGVWYKINYQNRIGYVHSNYVSVLNNSTSNNNDVAFSSSAYVGDTEGQGLNLRTAPSSSSTVLSTIPQGSTLSVVAKNGNWYKVNYNGKIGYVASSYIVLGNKPANNGDVMFSSAAYVGDTKGQGLNLRSGASTSSSVLTVIPQGSTLSVVAKNGSWYKVNYNGKTGYVASSYIVLGDKPSNNGDVAFSSDAYVGDTKGQGLNLRSGASTSSSVLSVIPQGATLNIIAKNGSWYKVNYSGKTGYVASSYIVLGNKPSSSPNDSVQSKYEVVLSAMKSHIGSPYVWGGSGEYITYDSIAALRKKFPDANAKGWYDTIGSRFYNSGYRAFDCSGLMQWGFAQAGIKIGRTTYSQVNDGYAVSRANVKPGDLLITKSQGHVGMYVGDNKWIESPYSGGYIRIHTVNWNNIGYIRRVL